MILEVLSPSTRRTDEAQKYRDYLTIPTLQTYILAETESPALTLYRRDGESFKRKVVSGLDKALALPDAKIISPWKHSGFNIHHGGEQPIPAHDAPGRKRLAEPSATSYLAGHQGMDPGRRSGPERFNQERDPTGAEPECFDQPVRRSLLTAMDPRATAVGEGVSTISAPLSPATPLPLRSGPKAASKPYRQKQIPSS